MYKPQVVKISEEAKRDLEIIKANFLYLGKFESIANYRIVEMALKSYRENLGGKKWKNPKPKE